jgi:Fe-S oxidoreductase
VKEGKMPLPTSDILGIFQDNLDKRGSVLPLPTGAVTKWAKGLDIPKGGETILYTGEMYQLISYINLMVSYIERIEDSPLSRFVKLGRLVNKAFNISGLMLLLGRGKAEQYDRILRNIALLLQKAGVSYGYLYEDELYCGALAYRAGLDDSVERHARRVYKMLREHGVKNLITVDPHTTDLFRIIYPSILGEFISTKSYMEVLVERGISPERAVDMDVVMHDSCCYARYEGITEQPRLLLEKAQFRIKEPKDSGVFTMCCGGPIEALRPKRAYGIAERRVEQLKAVGENIVVTCPICHASLSRAARNGVKVNDLSTFLAMAYL